MILNRQGLGNIQTRTLFVHLGVGLNTLSEAEAPTLSYVIRPLTSYLRFDDGSAWICAGPEGAEVVVVC